MTLFRQACKSLGQGEGSWGKRQSKTRMYLSHRVESLEESSGFYLCIFVVNSLRIENSTGLGIPETRSKCLQHASLCPFPSSSHQYDVCHPLQLQQVRWGMLPFHFAVLLSTWDTLLGVTRCWRKSLWAKSQSLGYCTEGEHSTKCGRALKPAVAITEEPDLFGSERFFSAGPFLELCYLLPRSQVSTKGREVPRCPAWGNSGYFYPETG